MTQKGTKNAITKGSDVILLTKICLRFRLFCFDLSQYFQNKCHKKQKKRLKCSSKQPKRRRLRAGAIAGGGVPQTSLKNFVLASLKFDCFHFMLLYT